jgi:N,N'-diacetyllegionaminate synthase
MKPLKIVAEIAQGYEGKPDLAMQLLEAAAAAGADAVKYQLIYGDEISTPGYQYYDLFKSLEMTDSVWEGLVQEAKKRKVELYLDIFGEKGLAKAERWGVDGVKIHSTDMLNMNLMKNVSKSSIGFHQRLLQARN